MRFLEDLKPGIMAVSVLRIVSHLTVISMKSKFNGNVKGCLNCVFVIMKLAFNKRSRKFPEEPLSLIDFMAGELGILSDEFLGGRSLFFF